MKKLDLTYQLTYEEAYEAFRVLASRRRRSTRIAASCVIVVAAITLLVLYGMDGVKIHYLFLAVCCIAVLFYLVYQPVISAKRGAANVAKAAGTYHIILYENGTIDLPGEKGISIHGDKFARSVETDKVFALRPDPQHTICIPKRLLKDRDADMIRDLL